MENLNLTAKPSKGLVLSTSILSATLFAALLSGCTPARWQETRAPRTGDEIAERKVTDNPPTEEGQTGYVVTDRLRVLTDPNQPWEEANLILERNDKVRILDPKPQGPDGLIKVIILETNQPVKPTQPVYVPRLYIGREPAQQTAEEADADRYFVIQNVATEKLRVYERCKPKNCAHRLILETDMVAGQDTPDLRYRTILGSYRITEWFKFYEDVDHDFPSWFNPLYPDTPTPGASLSSWLSPEVMPKGRGDERGSFGWYTAKIGPNAYAQWTHGTLGWGAEGDRFIRLTRLPAPEGYIRSRGCTRVENQAIAFMREILPVGTRVIKVYAKEALRDPTLAKYKDAGAKWDWILTKEGVDTNGPKAGRESVLAQNVRETDVLEIGSYALDQKPDAVPFKRAAGGSYNENGNLYDVPESKFKGYLIVDEGRLVNYQHPSVLFVGGHSDHALPSFVLSKDSKISFPVSKTKQEILNGTPPNDTKLPNGTVLNEPPKKEKREHKSEDVPDPTAELLRGH